MELKNHQMVSIPFTHVTDDGKGVMLNSDITVADAYMNNVVANADQIWVWIPEIGGYHKFFLKNDGKWYYSQGSKGLFEATSVTEGGKVYDYSKGLPLGSSFFYKGSSRGTAAASMTGAGAIESEPEVEIGAELKNHKMMANPYPTALMLNDAEQITVEGPYMNNVVANADQIWVWVAEIGGYHKFFLKNDGKWYYSQGSKGLFEATSVTEGGTVYDYSKGIPAGRAFYYKGSSRGTAAANVVFKKNF